MTTTTTQLTPEQETRFHRRQMAEGETIKAYVDRVYRVWSSQRRFRLRAHVAGLFARFPETK